MGLTLYVVRVFNLSEFHFSEVTFFHNWYFSNAARHRCPAAPCDLPKSREACAPPAPPPWHMPVMYSSNELTNKCFVARVLLLSVSSLYHRAIVQYTTIFPIRYSIDRSRILPPTALFCKELQWHLVYYYKFFHPIEGQIEAKVMSFLEKKRVKGENLVVLSSYWHCTDLRFYVVAHFNAMLVYALKPI